MTVAGKAWSRDKVGPKPVPLTPDPDLGIADPAKGERVPRCATCGMPGPRYIEGQWAGFAVRYPVCSSCIQRANGPLLQVDPLYVSEEGPKPGSR